MRLLLQVAKKVKHHSLLFIATFLTLIALTIASQLEMCLLGVISNSGVDFFALFGKKNQETLSLDQVQSLWPDITGEKSGHLSRSVAATYVAKKSQGDLFRRFLYRIQGLFSLNQGGLVRLIFFLVFIALFKGIFLFLSRYTTQALSVKVSRDLRQQYFEHIQKLPMSFYQKHPIGSLASRVVSDAHQISLALNGAISNYLHAPITIAFTFFICVCISWKLSLIIFVGLPLIIAPIVILTRKVKRITREWQKRQEGFTSVLIEFLSGIQTIKVFSMEKFSKKKYQEQNNAMTHLEVKTAKYDLLTRPILHAMTTFCLASVVIFGLYVLKMTVSELLVFCGTLYLFYEPIRRFADVNANIQKGVVAAERLFEVLNLQPNIVDCPKSVSLDFQSLIAFEDVWFRYKDAWVLKGVSFKVRKGESIAIVGATGSGKSTLVKLLPRLYSVDRGDIKIDGKSITTYTQKSLRQNIAFVPQSPFLFYDTLRANVTFGKSFSDEAVRAAIKQAHAEDFVLALPQGYDAALDEMGNNLSGGQKQRLAIARALIKKAPILVLDEATSALDALSERAIKEALIELRGKITQLIIAHRLSTIEHVDRIIFLEKGKKIAEGTLSHLLKTCLPFKLMWESHFCYENVKALEVSPTS